MKSNEKRANDGMNKTTGFSNGPGKRRRAPVWPFVEDSSFLKKFSMRPKRSISPSWLASKYLAAGRTTVSQRAEVDCHLEKNTNIGRNPSHFGRYEHL